MGKYPHKVCPEDEKHTPKIHATSHHDGESDPVDHDQLLNFLADKHINWTNATENFYTTGTGRFTGNLGVGSAPVSSSIIYATKASPTLSAGLSGQVTNSKATGTASIRGLFFYARGVPASQTGDVVFSEIVGAYAISHVENASYEHNTSATVMSAFKSGTEIIKLYPTPLTVTANRQFWAVNPTITGGGILNLNIAYYDTGQIVGIDKWGFYGLTAKNYMSGTLQTGGYISQDGSVGVSGSFVSADGVPKTITVKNGIITSII